MNALRHLARWFTQDRRQAIQVAAGSLAPLVILAGLSTEAQAEQALVIVGAVLQFVSSGLSAVNATWRDAFGILRGAIYALAATVAPALVLLGVFDEATSASLLTGLSLGLSSLSSLLAIFTVSQQKDAALHAEMAALSAARRPDGSLESRAQYRERTTQDE